jgi:hypothetical protein
MTAESPRVKPPLFDGRKGKRWKRGRRMREKAKVV